MSLKYLIDTVKHYSSSFDVPSTGRRSLPISPSRGVFYKNCNTQVEFQESRFFQGKEGASLDQYVRIANDILFNPEGTIERVKQAYEEQLQADSDDGSQASLAGERALASIERVSDDLQEKVDQFEERGDALRERF